MASTTGGRSSPGKLLNEGLGKLHFWLFMIGFNLTFGPMHFLGHRRHAAPNFHLPQEMGWDTWNLVATIGAYMLGLWVIVFITNVILTMMKGERAGNDPWDGMTLEWTIPSPPPHYNFAVIPEVAQPRSVLGPEASRAGEPRADERHHADRVPGASTWPRGSSRTRTSLLEHDEHDAHAHIHMPDPSYWPPLAAVGLFIAGFGILVTAATGYGALVITAIGLLILLISIYGWSLEPVNG